MRRLAIPESHIHLNSLPMRRLAIPGKAASTFRLWYPFERITPGNAGLRTGSQTIPSALSFPQSMFFLIK